MYGNRNLWPIEMVVGVVSKYVHTPNSRNEEVCQWLTVKANDTNLLSNCPRSSFIYNALHTLQFKEFREFKRICKLLLCVCNEL